MTTYVITEIESNFNQGKFEEVLELIKLKKSNNSALMPIALAEIYYFESRTYERIGNWKKAWKTYIESENVLNDVNNTDSRIKLILLTTRVYLLWRFGKLDEGIMIIEDNKEFLDKLESEKEILSNNFSIGYWLGLYFIIISNFYLQLGILNIAWNLNEKSYNYFSDIDYELYIGKILTNFGEIHLLRGEINQSLEKYQKSVELSTKTHDPITSIEGFLNIGQINYFLSKNDEALEYYQKAIKIAESLNNYYYEAKINYQIMLFYYNFSDKEKVLKIFDKLSKLSNQAPDNAYINQLMLIGKALNLLLSESLKNVIIAQEILMEVYNDPVIDFEVYFFVMILLTELHLLEYKIFNNKTILKNIDQLIDRMLSLATKNDSTRLIIESRLLQAKIETISGNLNLADKIFTQVEFKAEEKNLNILLNKTKNEHSRFKQQLNNWKKMIDENATGLQLLEYADLTSYLKELKKEINFDKFT